MWRVAVTVPAGAAETFAWALEPFADTIGIFGIEDDRRSPDPPTWETDLWLADRCVVEIVSEVEPDRPGIVAAIAVSAAERGIPRPEITFEELADRDWVAETYRGFPELTIGRYRIRGSHIDTPVPPNAITLTIDAAVAFGTGEHETTRGCLTAAMHGSTACCRWSRRSAAPAGVPPPFAGAVPTISSSPTSWRGRWSAWRRTSPMASHPAASRCSPAC